VRAARSGGGGCGPFCVFASSRDFLAKTFMTCLPVTGHCNKRKPQWVEFNNKRVEVNY
jgi:hypothetical protein